MKQPSEIAKKIRKDNLGRNLFIHALFVEKKNMTQRADGAGPYYSLHDQEWKGYPSMREMYLSCNDITEYEQAIYLLGSWDHWQALVKSNTLAPYLPKWREELEAKVRSQAIKKLMDSDRTDAAKWIAERKWDIKRGRPTNAEIEKERRIQANIKSDIDEMYDAAHQETETRLN